jgi:hypothetical protein
MAYRRNKGADTGAVMPFVAMALCLLLITAGICIDLMRAFETVHQLEFGAQTAALYGLSLSTNALTGSYSTAQAQTNILTAIAQVADGAWNSAQSGPQNGFLPGGIWSSPVTFGPTQFVTNPLDPTEFFVQVTAQRTGMDALQQFFIPLAYVGLPPNGGIPPQVQTAALYSTVEVLGQPATRIGYGPPVGSAPGTRAGALYPFAALPIAISNQQFAAMAIPTNNPAQAGFTIDLVTSTSQEYSETPPPGHVKGCLVNVAGTGSGSGANFYGPAVGETAIEQLEGLLSYFGAVSEQQPIAPALVEAGSSQLSAFDPANASNTSDPDINTTQLLNVLATLPTVNAANIAINYIVPVLANDPSFTANNTVVGFAYLQLAAPFVESSNTNTLNTLSITMAPSVPVRNASSATGFSSIPGNTGNLMLTPPFPPLPPPFQPRFVDPTTNGVTQRPQGIVLAPAVSPRQIAPPIVVPSS